MFKLPYVDQNKPMIYGCEPIVGLIHNCAEINQSWEQYTDSASVRKTSFYESPTCKECLPLYTDFKPNSVAKESFCFIENCSDPDPKTGHCKTCETDYKLASTINNVIKGYEICADIKSNPGNDIKGGLWLANCSTIIQEQDANKNLNCAECKAEFGMYRQDR